MVLRNDDELPPLTPSQQAEAIRIAARLQAAHEAHDSNEALLLAAEEAGIERRFLHEAVARLSPEVTATRLVPIAPVVAAFSGIGAAALWFLFASYTLEQTWTVVALVAGLILGVFGIRPRSAAILASAVWLLFGVIQSVYDLTHYGAFGPVFQIFIVSIAFRSVVGAALGAGLSRLARHRFSLTHHAPPVTLHSK